MLKRLRDYINRRNRPFWSIASDQVAVFNGEVGMVMQRDRMASDKAAIERLKYGLEPEPTGHEKELLDRMKPYVQKNSEHTITVNELPRDRHGEVDSVNHPPHYNNSPAKCDCGRRIECIDVTRHHNFNIGNAIKYLWRCDLKGASVEDLRKAVWYIQDEISERLK